MFAGILPPGSMCRACNRDRAGHQGTISASGFIECQDCLFGIRPKLETPISHLNRTPIPKNAAYLISDEGVVHVPCAVCAEIILLSSARDIVLGKFVRTTREIPERMYDPEKHTLIAVSDTLPRTVFVEQSIPRTWKAKACDGCAEGYDAAVLTAGRLKSNQQPFLKL